MRRFKARTTQRSIWLTLILSYGLDLSVSVTFKIGGGMHVLVLEGSLMTSNFEQKDKSTEVLSDRNPFEGYGESPSGGVSR